MTSLAGEGARVMDKYNGEKFNLWKVKMEMVLAPWTVGILWANSRKLYLPMWIPKWRRNTKCTSRRPYILLASIWLATNLHTSRVAKDQWKHGKPFAKFTRWRVLCNILFIRRKFSKAFMWSTKWPSPRYGEWMWATWYDREREEVHLTFTTAGSNIWMSRVFMDFKTWWVVWTYAKFLIPPLHWFVKHVRSMMQRLPTNVERQTTKALEIVYSCVCDFIKITFVGGAKYLGPLLIIYWGRHGCICWNPMDNALRSLKISKHL